MMKKDKLILGIGFAYLLSVHFLVAQCVTAVDAVDMTVSDLDKATAFYTQVLGFEKMSEIEVYGSAYEQLKGQFGIRYKKARLRLGGETLDLTDFLTAGGKPVPPDSRSNDLWFQHIAIVVSNMDSAYAVLRKFKVEHVSTGPQTLPVTNKAAAGIKAFYFHDPDGHTLEVIYFPPDKGNPKWHRTTDQLFLGIDHTAIGISNTLQSADFYQELLGMTRGGESFNQGTEQEHLNNVSGASLHITGNRASQGPGVEFLEYLKPSGGRPYPSDARGDDLITLPDAGIGYQKGFYVKDPDGHLVGIFEK